MTLSERERRALAEIESHLARDDPALARRLSTFGWRRTRRLWWMVRDRGRVSRPPGRRWLVASAVVLLAGAALVLVGGVAKVTPALFAGAALIAMVPLLAMASSVVPRRLRPRWGTPSRVP